VIRYLAIHSRSLQKFDLSLPEKQTLHLDFRDSSAWYWLNNLLGDKFEENGLIQAIIHFSKPEDVIWDVGGNCGLFSYLLAKNLPKNKIVFFEPNPFVYRIACEALKPFSNVQGVNAGLSSKSDASALLTIPPGGSACGTLENIKTQSKGQALKVRLCVGDRLVETGAYPAPDIVKIDTEGHEIDVIKGLSELIKTKRPKVFFEHISLTEKDIQNHLPAKYKFVSISDCDGSLHHKFDRTVGHNSVMIPEIIN